MREAISNFPLTPGAALVDDGSTHLFLGFSNAQERISQHEVAGSFLDERCIVVGSKGVAWLVIEKVWQSTPSEPRARFPTVDTPSTLRSSGSSHSGRQ
jgi:hypothetical protein